jgi:DNA-binding transcriptional LysR family regulator
MRHNITLKHVRCFLAVAHTGSFTAASARLCITPSALTATIQQLEAAIGARMFDRTTRRVTLTEHAARFLAEAERVVNGFDGAVSDLIALAQGQRGHIRIGAASSVISRFLLPVLPEFRSKYPEITISLRNSAAQQIERLVLEGEVDFAIDSKYQGFDELAYTPLICDAYGVACRRDSPIASPGRPLRWDELNWGRYIGFNADTGIRHFLRDQVPWWKPLNEEHDEVEGTSYLFDFLASGDYYAVLPSLSFHQNTNPALCWTELEQPHLNRELCVMTRALRSLSPSAQHLLALLNRSIETQSMPAGVSRIDTGR